MHLRELVAAVAQGQCAALKARAQASLKGLWLLVGDVEHTRHLVAVLGVEAAGREVHLLHHVAVDDTQSLLLAVGDQLRAIHLDAVDVDAVLVVGAAAHHVLRAHLVLAAHTRLGGDDVLHGVAAGAWRHLGNLDVDALHGVGLLLVLGDLNLLQLYRLLVQLGADVDGAHRLDDAPLHVAVAYAGEHHVDGILLGYSDFVAPVEVGVHAKHRALDPHRGKLHRLVVFIDNRSSDFYLSVHCHRRDAK